VKCLCGAAFCFRCGEEAHDPAACQQVATWNEKCMNESETANWILANTRKCSQCHTRIEKVSNIDNYNMCDNEE
jgi:ariadne-1